MFKRLKFFYFLKTSSFKGGNKYQSDYLVRIDFISIIEII
jgi:hypothetical protein